MTEIKVDSADIIGQSDGGILALLLAIRHPSRVKKVVANAPNLRPDDTAVAAWLLPLTQQALDQAKAMIAKGDHSKDWVRIKRWNELLLNELHIPLTKLRRIQAPVLISGADDDVIKPEHLLEIYRSLPRAHLSIMPGATHFLHQGEHERFNTLAERFLRSPFIRPTSKHEIEREVREQLQP